MRLAREQDYERLQGGIPFVKFKDGLWHIQHHPKIGSPLVKTRRDPLEEDVSIDLDGETVIFKSGLLYQFEGYPCELESIRRGGAGWERNHFSAKRRKKLRINNPET